MRIPYALNFLLLALIRLFFIAGSSNNSFFLISWRYSQFLLSLSPSIPRDEHIFSTHSDMLSALKCVQICYIDASCRGDLIVDTQREWTFDTMSFNRQPKYLGMKNKLDKSARIE